MTVLSIYNKINDVGSFVENLGKSIALSKMFGCESEAQGQVIALECLAKQMPPLSIAERFHLIHGKLSKKSEAMLAEFRESLKGSHRVIRRDPDGCEIELTTRDRQTLTFSLTWEEAKLEPFCYDGRESEVIAKITAGEFDKLKLKSKYATPRSRMQMLWSRLVSDSIRCVAPEIVCGNYSPEEIGDFSELETAETVETSVEDIPSELVEKMIEEAVVVKKTAVEIPTAEEMTAEIEPEEPDAVRVDGPCLPHQVEQIKDALSRAKQQGDLDIVDRLKSWLQKTKIEKLSNLTYNEANQLNDSLEQKIVHKFFELDLSRDHSKKN